ncbi:MAG: DMT family protein [Muribaculaceae bacterium]|nr:DMT family protein [Muribaculaceae bacterium]
MNVKLITILLLIISNVFMTFAWYGHLRLQQSGISKDWPLFVVILVSWGIALLEYFFMIPANRMGFSGNGGPFSLIQLKVIQEVVSLSVFTIVAMFLFSGEKFHWNHIAAFLCLVGAVYFAFMPAK